MLRRCSFLLPSRYLLRQRLRQDVAQSTHEASTGMDAWVFPRHLICHQYRDLQFLYRDPQFLCIAGKQNSDAQASLRRWSLIIHQGAVRVTLAG